MWNSAKKNRCYAPVLFALGFLSVVILALLLLYFFSWKSAREIETFERQIRAQGEPVELAELDAYYPALPDHENAALIYEKLYPELDVADSDGERSKALLKRIHDVGLTEAFDPSLRADLEDSVGDFAEVMSICDAAREFSAARFSVRMDQGMLAERPYLNYLKSAASLQFIVSTLAVEDRDWDGLVMAQGRVMHIAQMLEGDPNVISQLVRSGLHVKALRSLERTLNQAPLPSNFLHELTSIHALTEGKDAARRAFVVERCMAAQVIRQATSAPYTDESKASLPGWIARAVVGERPQRVLIYTFMGELVALADEEWPAWVTYSLGTQKRADEIPDRYYGPKTILPSYGRSALALVRGATAQRLLRTALAIELYRAERGALPRELEALVPEYVSAVPTDPFDGEPLRYRPKDTGYVLYSVFLNREDDHGVRYDSDGEPWSSTGDFVLEVGR